MSGRGRGMPPWTQKMRSSTTAAKASPSKNVLKSFQMLSPCFGPQSSWGRHRDGDEGDGNESVRLCRQIGRWGTPHHQEGAPP